MSGLPIDIVDSNAGSGGTATASATGTDFGNVGRNVLRGPKQNNVDFLMSKRVPFGESRSIEFRAEFFNLFNQVNFANPISNFNAFASSGGSIDPNTGQIIRPGDFGRIISTSNNSRLIQLALKLNFQGGTTLMSHGFWLVYSITLLTNSIHNRYTCGTTQHRSTQCVWM